MADGKVNADGHFDYRGCQPSFDIAQRIQKSEKREGNTQCELYLFIENNGEMA